MVKHFLDSNSNQLDHYFIPTLVDDKPDVVLLHVGSNDMFSNDNNTKLANNIINIGLNCKNHSVSKVLISSTLVKKKSEIKSCYSKS